MQLQCIISEQPCQTFCQCSFCYCHKICHLDNLSQTTRIIATNSNFVMKSTIKCVHSLSKTLSSTFPLVPLSDSSFSNIYQIYLHIFLHLLSSLTTSNFLSPILLFFIFFHVLLPVHHGVTGLSSLSTPHSLIYNFPFFNTKSLSIYYSLPFNTLTSVFFISSITLTTSLSFSLAIFIFSNISISGPSITTSVKL